jgi:hypothetical protein
MMLYCYGYKRVPTRNDRTIEERKQAMINRKRMLFHGLPIIVLFFPLAWYTGAGSDYWLKGEKGIVENMTVLFLVIAIGFSISGFFKARKLDLSILVKGWLVLLILGALYFALEEISYGQHMFGWGTGEAWKDLNDQDETNLHNTHAIFDQIPRAMLMIGILVGGVILPVIRKLRKTPLKETELLYWHWPTSDCITAGLLVVLIRPILSMFDVTFIDTGEMKENFFGLFIMLYCVSLQMRLKQTTIKS